MCVRIVIAGASRRADHGVMTAGSVQAEVERLVDLVRAGRLPFEAYQIGSSEGRLEVAVSRIDHRAALDYFAKHPVTQADGTSIPVDVCVLAGSCWISEPIRAFVGNQTHPRSTDWWAWT